MKRMMITESVRNLLLDSDFLESVLSSPIVEPDANSGRPASSRKFEKMYLPAEIEQAKYVLLHLDEISGLLTETDIEELKNRIKSHLYPQNGRENTLNTNFSHYLPDFSLEFAVFRLLLHHQQTKVHLR